MKTRKWLVWLTIVAVLVLLAGCGSGSGSGSSSSPSPSQSSQNTQGTSGGQQSGGTASPEPYPSHWPKRVTVAAGIMGGPWYPLMVKVSEVLMREIPELTVNVIEGGSLANTRIINEGVDAQMGLAYANIVYDAYEGKFDDKQMTNVRMTNAYMTSYVQFLVPQNSPIQKLEDAFNKKIGSSPRGGGPDLLWQIILDYYGLTYEDIRAKGGNVNFVDFNQQALMMKDGQIDVGLFTGEAPHAAAMEAEVSVPLRAIPLDMEMINALNQKYPYLVAAELPGDAYKGMDGPVTTLSIPGVFIVNKDLPEDFVEKIVSTVMENHEEIQGSFHFVDLLDWENFKLGIGDDLWHPAAKKVYENRPK
jgi:hypothetical protein